MSTDKLTQLQAEFNQLLIQFYSVYSYNAQRHPLEPPAAIPGLAFTALKQTEPGPEDTDPTKTAYPLEPVDQKTFDEAQEELAEDLVLKTQQIQRLIADLPGIDQDQAQQAEVIRKLVGEVNDMDKARRNKRREMRQLVKRLDALISATLEHTGINLLSEWLEGAPLLQMDLQCYEIRSRLDVAMMEILDKMASVNNSF